MANFVFTVIQIMHAIPDEPELLDLKMKLNGFIDGYQLALIEIKKLAASEQNPRIIERAFRAEVIHSLEFVIPESRYPPHENPWNFAVREHKNRLAEWVLST